MTPSEIPYMSTTAAAILMELDRAAEASDFPVLDHGYVFLAATRLSAFRSKTDWAMVIEVFGFSPRAGVPDTSIFTCGSCLYNRYSPNGFANQSAYEQYVSEKTELRSAQPIDSAAWQDRDDFKLVSNDASDVSVRQKTIPLPALDVYERYDIRLEKAPRVQVIEVCRWLAAVERDRVLATPEERSISVEPSLTQLVQLEEWHHPDIANGELPSSSNTLELP